MDDPIYLSPSAIDTARMCGVKWEHEHPLRTPRASGLGPSQVRGRALHRAAETALRYVVAHRTADDRQDMPLEAIQQAAVDEADRMETGVDIYEREDGTVTTTDGPKPEWALHEEDPGANKDLLAYDMVPRWHERILPTIEPEAVEAWGRVELADPATGLDVVLRARLDVLPADGVITDLKHSKFSFGGYNYGTPDDATASVQLSTQDVIYRQLKGVPPVALGFDTLGLRESTKPQQKAGALPGLHVADILQPRVPARTEHQLDKFYDLVTRVARGIQAGVFLPAPDGAWWCSEKWCQFWRVCKHAQGR